jgi:UDP-N-acetylglucosamine--N-acetylmuramyl-(pentapeptide) pyrophosphoryl-undecaprenol N-acetylglucosamine transferase
MMRVPNSSIRVVFAGGGTGGHLFPAIAIAERLIERGNADLMFVGTKNKIEARVVPQLGYKFRTIWIGGFSRKFRLSNLLLPLKIFVSIFQSLKLLLKFKPQVVVGTGGYVSGPVCAAAVMTRTPIVLQEHNSYPGVMTRMFAPFAREIHIAFESSKKYFGKRSNLHLTGSPIRNMQKVRREDALKFFGLGTGRKTLLVTGGSLGAVRLNSALLEVVGELMDRNCQLIWQTGSVDYERVKDSFKVNCSESQNIKIVKFVDRIEFAYLAADIAVCRGGATTIAELIYFNLPALILPYPYAAANHQVENTRALVEAGAAVMVLESEMKEKFKRELMNLLDNPDEIASMRKKMKTLQHHDAAAAIAESVLKIAGENA